jgi:hypothetical protein
VCACVHIHTLPVKVKITGGVKKIHAGKIYDLHSHLILLSNSVWQSPSLEADSNSVGQKISHLLWNLKVHCHFHKSLSLNPNLSELIPIQTATPLS